MRTTALSFALRLGVVGALSGGDPCAPGYKLKSNMSLMNLTCSNTTTSTASCAACCEVDLTKCDNPNMRHGTDMVAASGDVYAPVTWHGIPLTYVKCPPTHFQDPSKAGMARMEVNEKISDGVKECCTERATCKQVKCLGATAPKKDAVNISCVAGVSSCEQSICCEPDNTKCGARPVVCGRRCSGNWAKCDPKGPPCEDGSQCEATYHDEDKAALQVNAANEVSTCCSKMKTCAAHKCVNGTRAKLTITMEVDKTVLNLPTSFLKNWDHVCCEKDNKKCGGQTPGLWCDAGTLLQTERVGTTKDVCCQPVATCAAFASSKKPAPRAIVSGSVRKLQPSVTRFVLALAGMVTFLELR